MQKGLNDNKTKQFVSFIETVSNLNEIPHKYALRTYFLTYVGAFSATNLISRHAKAQKFNLALSQDEKPYQTEHLFKEKSSAVLISNQTKILKGLIIPYFLILMTSRENQDCILTRSSKNAA